MRKYDRVSHARDDVRFISPLQMCDIRTVLMAHNVQYKGEPTDLAQLFETKTNAAARAGSRVTRFDHLSARYSYGDWPKGVFI